MKSLLMCVIVFIVSSESSKQIFNGDKVLRVKNKNHQHVKLIQEIAQKVKLDIWHPDSVKEITPYMTVDFHVRADDAKLVQSLLKQNGVKYEVLFHNLQDGIEAQLDIQRIHKSKKHSYTTYNDWGKIVDWAETVSSNYPNLVKLLKIGITTEHRPMYVLKIGNPSATRKSIFMDCGIHAREWISPAFCQWFVKEIIDGYTKNKRITNLLDNLTFYVLPVVNVDGYVWTWTKDRMWRKNRSRVQNCYGTDLNRNFKISWGGVGSSHDPCSDIYGGYAPESERETRNMAYFIRSHIDTIKAYISIHSYSQILMYPYAYTYRPVPNARELNKLCKGAVSELSRLYGTSYLYGPTASTVYRTSGSSDDWAYSKGIKYSFTFELRDKGQAGFLLPESQIQPTCRETTMAVLHIANYVLSHSS